MKSLKELLSDRWEKGQLAHFYLVRPHPKTLAPNQYLDQWVQDFLASIIQKDKKLASHKDGLRQLKMGQPDILIIKKDDSQKEYTLKDGDFDEFFQFQQYRALELSWRFVVVYDAHLIGKVIANKLLKTLEEPQDRTTILFLQPNRAKLLPTIESRALEIVLPPQIGEQKKIEKLQNEDNFLEWLETTQYSKPVKKLLTSWVNRSSSPQMILDKLKSKRELQEESMLILLEWESIHQSSYQHKDDFLQNLRWFEESKIYHNGALERLYGLLNQQFPH